MFAVVLFFLGLHSNAFAAEITCPSHQHIVRGHPRAGFINWKGNLVRDHRVVTHCRDNHKSYEIWGSAFAEGKPEGWPEKEKFKAWTVFEREEVLDALDKLPKYFADFRNVKIYRAVKSVTPHNYASSVDNSVVLYDSAFDDELKVRKAILHELAHVDFDRMSPDEETFAAIQSGWIAEGTPKTWKYIRGKRLEVDSASSPTEAYSNGVEAYFFNPTRLKFKDGILHEFLDQKFGKVKP